VDVSAPDQDWWKPWRHPRRVGFAIFNLIVIGLIVAWGNATSALPEGELADVPALLIGPAGTALLLGLLVAGWIVWIGFVVVRRWRKSRHRTP